MVVDRLKELQARLEQECESGCLNHMERAARNKDAHLAQFIADAALAMRRLFQGIIKTAFSHS